MWSWCGSVLTRWRSTPCSPSRSRQRTASIGCCGVSIMNTPSRVVTNPGLQPQKYISAKTCSLILRIAQKRSPPDVEPVHSPRQKPMCRSIKTLANFEPPATDDEIRAAAIQFVRKLSGATRPSRANEEAFSLAVDEVTLAAQRLIHSLQSTAAPRNRDEE